MHIDVHRYPPYRGGSSEGFQRCTCRRRCRRTRRRMRYGDNRHTRSRRPDPTHPHERPRPGGPERRRAGRRPARVPARQQQGQVRPAERGLVRRDAVRAVRPHLRRPAGRRRRLRRRHEQRRPGAVQLGRAVARDRQPVGRPRRSPPRRPRRLPRRSCKTVTKVEPTTLVVLRARRRRRGWRGSPSWMASAPTASAGSASTSTRRTGKVLGTQEHVTEGTGIVRVQRHRRPGHHPVGQHLHHEGPGHHQPQLPGRGQQHHVQRPGRRRGATATPPAGRPAASTRCSPRRPRSRCCPSGSAATA